MKTDIDGIVKALENDDELVGKIVDAWRRGAEAKEVLAIFEDADIEAEIADIEEALRQFNARKAEAVSDGFEDLTEAERMMVAGGILGALGQGGCDSSYFGEQCSATVETGSWCGSNDWCSMFSTRYDYHDADDNPCGPRENVQCAEMFVDTLNKILTR